MYYITTEHAIKSHWPSDKSQLNSQGKFYLEGFNVLGIKYRVNAGKVGHFFVKHVI